MQPSDADAPAAAPAAAPPSALHDVLLVDDSDLVHQLVGVWLKGEPLALHGSTTAAAGLEAARSIRPDLILLDIDLPDGDGFDVCRTLKADPLTAHVPVVFLTGASGTEEKIRGLDLGAVDYVTKPFHPAEFRARVRAALRTKELTDLLATRAQIDGLTGLRNRAYLDEQMLVARATLRRTGRPFGLALLDVDHFKQLNDAHGHPFGDGVLRQIAGVLTRTCRAEDVVCRYGGEEFAVLTPGVPLPGVAIMSERVRAGVAGLGLSRSGRAVGLTVSLGCTDVTVADDDAATDDGHDPVLDRADAALYRAKADGRDRVVIEAAATRSAERPAPEQAQPGLKRAG